MKSIKGYIMPLLVSIGFVVVALWNYYSKPLNPFLFACNTLGFLTFSTFIVVIVKQMIKIKRKG